MKAVVVDTQLHRGQIEQRVLYPMVGTTASQVREDLHDAVCDPIAGEQLRRPRRT